ncbi:MAG: methionine--tRNA ligase [Phycisphaerales bacterium]
MPSAAPEPYYITTPIYYVNDRPHVGHTYTTIVADAIARFMRLSGRDVFFLTGTDEHAEKVVESAARQGVTPQQWADRNAAEFQKAFAFAECSHDDFIRTTEPRHTKRVRAYISAMQGSGDIYLGDYVGWYDPSQEEYLTETVAREHDYKSPVTGRELIKRVEKNYFFALSRYQERLLAHIKANPGFIQPEARRNEVLGRLSQGLSDVPVSRAVAPGTEGDAGWGILMPGDEGHRVYVWIDALFNYLSTVDDPEAADGDRTRFWPAQVHLIAKDILWFHAVIWPCMLMALDRPLPKTVYAHSFWIREGRKMSKSLGNFLDLPTIKAYCDAYAGAFGVDAWRWFMLTQGPLGATDADFVHDKFVDCYNADLANGIGNAASRVINMIHKYFDGRVPDPGAPVAGSAIDLESICAERAGGAVALAERGSIGEALRSALGISNAVDQFINDTTPFKLAKVEGRLPEVGAILYRCIEALRIAAVLLCPAMPRSMGVLLQRLGQPAPDAKGAFPDAGTGAPIPFARLIRWGGMAPGSPVALGEGLFPRADPTAAPPVPIPGES